MRIGIDLDGVCYEFQRTFRYMMREYRGVVMPPVSEFWFYWDAQKEYGTKADHRWMWNEGVEKGLFRYGHMVRGCRRGLEALVADGHELVVCTTRPESAVEDTLAWVELFFKDIPIGDPLILHNARNKNEVRADLLIDDKPENVEAWTWTNRTAVLFDQPWNQTYITCYGRCRPSTGHVYRAKGWEEVVDVVRSEGAGRDSANLPRDVAVRYYGRRPEAGSRGEALVEG